jgi:hypothetical protein
VLKCSLLRHSSIASLGLLSLLAQPLAAEPTRSNPFRLQEHIRYETTADILQIRGLPAFEPPSLDAASVSFSRLSDSENDAIVGEPALPIAQSDAMLRLLYHGASPAVALTNKGPHAQQQLPSAADPRINQSFSQAKPEPGLTMGFNALAPGQNPPLFIAQEVPDDQELPAGDPELGIIQIRSNSADPELGTLRIQEQPVVPDTPSQTPVKTGFFTARFAAASSDNILLAVNDVGGLTGDEFLRPGISIAFYPRVGPQTFLIGNADVGLQRYNSQSDFNYDDLRFRLGVRQGLFPRTYGQLMFTYQQLFRPGPPRFRFFENTAFSFTLGRRDPLTNQLTLNSYYQIQLNDTESRPALGSPTDLTQFDRITQSLGGYLNYTINPQWRTGVSYQVTFSDYTGQERYDTYHQLIGQLIYRITPDVRMSLYGGWSFGQSSESFIRLNDTLFGFTIDATVTLF